MLRKGAHNKVYACFGSALGRKFLGCAMWVGPGPEVKFAVAGRALDDFKVRMRQLTLRSGRRSSGELEEKLQPCLLGLPRPE
jgi:RNA-directed DNA polymerase